VAFCDERQQARTRKRTRRTRLSGIASVQARHSRKCFYEGAWTPASKTGPKSDCTCRPGFFIVHHAGRRLVREPAGWNLQQAERLRDKRAVELREGSYIEPSKVTFEEWGQRWLDSLERKQTTVDSYRSTIAYAGDAFGSRPLGKIGVGDITDLNANLREKKLSDVTRGKHLRVLQSCFSAAVAHGLIARNPVKGLPSGQRPRPRRKEAAYFENSELPLLFKAFPTVIERVLFQCALKTGMRQGELLGLRWGDVDLTGAVIHVRQSYTGGIVTTPKTHERRDVDVSTDLVKLLGEWWGESDGAGDDQLVFPGPGRNGFLSPTSVLRLWLYPAMVKAEIPRVGPTGEKRTFHSLRHTFAKRALESDRPITWLSRHLGHSSVQVTTGVYGHWEKAERKRQMKRMEGVFGV